MQIGINIKKIRTQQHRTLQNVSNACGFTISLLSKIENGVVVPPVATLAKIAAALGVKMSVLLEDGLGDGVAFTNAAAAEAIPRAITDKGYEFITLAAEYPDKKAQPCIIVGKKGQVTEHRVSHEGEEFIYVLEGQMTMTVGNVGYLMGPGDSLYFNSLIEHGFLPVTDEVRYINLFIE